jgi:RNA polymerase sigma-70 factor (ECF subfamily)
MIAPDGFVAFFEQKEQPIRQALSAELGFDLGKDSAAHALAYAWEHWDRIKEMDNPAGYVFRVGQRYGRRQRRRPPQPAAVSSNVEMPWVEPALSVALKSLSRHQRIAVVLVHGLGWTRVEVAELLGIKPTTVQNHVERGLKRLRQELEVSGVD